MNWKEKSFDWNQVKTFLSAVETGSLSAAARQLGLTQPTLSRQISTLEESLGVVLLERGHRSLSLTQAGLEILEYAQKMDAIADKINLIASGQSQNIEGTVCITASDTLSAYHLPPILKKLRALAPKIQVEVHASNEVKNLLRREADIAIRHVRPQQLDLITKRVNTLVANLYASENYLKELAHPQTEQQLLNASFIGFENPQRAVEIYETFGLKLTQNNIHYITNSAIVVKEMIQKGAAIGIMDDKTAALTNDIKRLTLPFLKPVTYPIWLTTHKELHTSRRIRFVYDFLAEQLK